MGARGCRAARRVWGGRVPWCWLRRSWSVAVALVVALVVFVVLDDGWTRVIWAVVGALPALAAGAPPGATQRAGRPR